MGAGKGRNGFSNLKKEKEVLAGEVEEGRTMKKKEEEKEKQQVSQIGKQPSPLILRTLNQWVLGLLQLRSLLALLS